MSFIEKKKCSASMCRRVADVECVVLSASSRDIDLL